LIQNEKTSELGDSDTEKPMPTYISKKKSSDAGSQKSYEEDGPKKSLV
jgi:hypothetical protein